MIILGIDPGSRITGYGVIRKDGNRLIHIDNGAIFTASATNLPDRLKKIYRGITKIIEDYTPDTVAIEDIFFAENVKSALTLGQARGSAIVAGVNAGLVVHEYSALQVKKAVVGHGKAAKEQVQHMVKVLLNLPEIAQADASDALAVAICHANSSNLKSLTALIPTAKGRRSFR
ncbi:MAG: crossover junction endodeoxyribonuclease RuvC [Desulfuromonadales bacterium]|nr:crossover junction endodeoxyribonuclease RuvC [Desulfuromonadales bacterium]